MKRAMTDLFALALVCAAMTLVGCSKSSEGDYEKAGKEAGKAADQAATQAEKAAKDAGKALENIGQ